MQRRAILVLLVAVAALSALLLVRRSEIEEAARPEEQLFPGFDPAALERLEVHHLERGTEVVLERDASGRWFMTEPVPYPAEEGMVGTLQGLLGGTRGRAVEGGDPAALGLDPPRIVVVWRGGGAGGRLEIGAQDVDRARVFARADGRVLRVTRAISSALEQNPDDYRDRAVTGLLASDVVSLRRRGSLVLAPGEPETDLLLDALLDPERGWTSPAPKAVALDPVLLGFLVRGAAELRVDRFQQDPPVDLAEHGLDPPRLRIELEDLRGERVALLFGCAEPGPVGVMEPARWFACREGYPHVFGVEHHAVGLLAAPVADLYDTLLLRAQRDDIASIELSGLVLARDGEAWVVRTPAGDLPADEGAVSDVLAALEFARVEGFDPELALGEPRAWLLATLRDGRRLGGEIGADLGSGRVALRRYGDELVGTAGAELLALARRGASDVRSRRVHELEDFQVAAVGLSGASRSARFERDPETGRWRAQDSAEPSHDFYTALERLLYLQARAWLAEAPADLAGEVRVSIERSAPGAGALDLVFGTDAAGRGLCVLSGGAAAEVDPALCADLLALLQ